MLKFFTLAGHSAVSQCALVILAAMASTGFRVIASAGAALSLAAAIGWDLGGAEHPTHTLGLVLVTAVVLLFRTRTSGRGVGMLETSAGAVAAQPAIHIMAESLGVDPDAAGGGLVHLLMTDGAAVGMQIVLSCAIAGAAAALAASTGLLGSVLRPVLLLVAARADRADEPTPLPRTPDAGMGRQRRNARVTRALRRGPPVPLVR